MTGAQGPRRLGLRALFVVLGLLVFTISGAGLVVFRIYDNQLIRQTESELIAQGAFIASAYKHALLTRLVGDHGAAEPPALSRYGNAVAEPWRAVHDPTQPLAPVRAHLSLGRDVVLAPAPPAARPAAPADADALAAGTSVGAILHETKRTTLAGLRVVDFRGVVVASSKGELGLTVSGREEVRRALTGEPVSLLRRRISDEPAPPYASLSRETGVRVFVALPVVAEQRVLGAVVLSRTPMTLGKAFYEDRFSLLAMAGVLIGAVLLVSLLAAALIVRPVRALIRQTRAIADGQRDGAAPIAHPGTREIAQLSQAFAAMSKRLGDRAEYIRGFAASVSHEFKTPLASIQGTVELLRDHSAEMSPEERARFLGNLTADTERMHRLVHRVLELARADMGEPAAARADLGQVLATVADRHRAAGTDVAIAGLSEAPVAVRAAPETVAAVFDHLLENAREHGGPSARVQICVAGTAAGEPVELEVRDDGPGISRANAAKVFDAFFTTARARGGTGMGLTIVRALLKAHGGSIELVEGGGDADRSGAAFRVRLPAA